MKKRKHNIVIKREMRDPVAKSLFRKTGSGIHKGIKDIPRSTQKQKLKKRLRKEVDDG